MMHESVQTDGAAAAVGPYSQAIVAQGQRMVFVSGQIPLDRRTMRIESQEVREQVLTVLSNLAAVLKEAKAELHHVVKTTVFLKNMADFDAVNSEYEKFFAPYKPARVCIEVARLPKDALVEIDAIAVI